MPERKRGSWAKRAAPWTIGLIALGVGVIVLRWAVFDATFGPLDPRACEGGTGACWALVREKSSLLLFGLYPPGELWRPTAVIALAALLTALWWRTVSRVRPLLAATFVIAAAMPLLMSGAGVLSPVSTDRWGGLALTVLLILGAAAVGIPAGILLALGRQSTLPIVRSAASAYVETVRALPLVAILIAISFLLPLLLPNGWTVDKLLRAVLGIGLFNAAYYAEAVRGGLLTVSLEQYRAAAALGMSRSLTLRTVVLPQALRRSIPAIVNTTVGVLKDTSLVVLIGLVDLVGGGRAAVADLRWRGHPLEIYVVLATAFVAIAIVFSRLGRNWEFTSEGRH